MAMNDFGGGKMASGRGGNAGPEGEMDALLLGKTRELVAATPSQRNWKGILIALLVICAVCGLILFSIYLLRPPDDGPRVKGRKITLSDITSSHFNIQPFNGTWISENELMFRDYLGGLSVLNADTLVSRPFIANTTFRQLNSNKFSVSQDRRFILFIHEERPVWKHSFLAKYTLYDIEKEFQSSLTPFEEGTSREQEQPELQYAAWGPQGNALVFVYQNDIYYKSGVESTRTFRITRSGQPGLFYNGIPDWIYEEEVLETNNAIWSSPDGKLILYASFNDTIVGEASYPWYADNLQYPNLRTLRYPKAGTNNPEVSLHAVNMESNSLESVRLKPPSALDSSDHYIARVRWVDNEQVVVVWMNRHQNMSIISTCRASKWFCEEIHTLKSGPDGWLDFPDLPIFSANGSSCIMRLPWRDGEAGYFQHVVWLNINPRKEIPITRGPFEVIRLVAWDQTTDNIYFIAAPQAKPGQRHLYRASEKSSNSTVMVAPVCITCPKGRGFLTPTLPFPYSHSPTTENQESKGDTFFHHHHHDHQTAEAESMSSPETSAITDFMVVVTPVHDGKNSSSNSSVPLSSSSKMRSVMVRLPHCLYNNVIFSTTYRYFVRECWGPGVPTVTLHSAPSGRLLLILDNRTALQEEVASLGLPQVKTFEVATKDGYHAPVRLFLPPGLREEEEYKFPMVLHVYGGPGSQLVSEKWGLSWATYLTSKKNFIVAQIDGRGTGYQGEKVRHSIYRKLGTLEVSDQIEVMKYLRDNLPFIDVENIAVWGWSYGGYVTALILSLDQEEPKLFRCAISVAPVTKWEFYDTTYTERYMGMPNFTDNYRGYENADLTRVADKLHTDNRTFLIIHGTADENVHYQHTIHLTKSLIKQGVTFTEQIYPDEGHELHGVKDHLYSTMEAFLDQCFGPLDFDEWEKDSFLGVKM